MASLYVKDPEAYELARKLAEQRGISKTAAVKIALRHELDRDTGPVATPRPALQILEELWRRHPLGTPTGLEADKAFYDSLNDEDED